MNNKMGGDLKKIQVVGRYLVEIWRAVGMNMERVQFLSCSGGPPRSTAGGWASAETGGQGWQRHSLQLIRIRLEHGHDCAGRVRRLQAQRLRHRLSAPPRVASGPRLLHPTPATPRPCLRPQRRSTSGPRSTGLW
jgi:hypothetical protein